jgi:four helix bundle protein
MKKPHKKLEAWKQSMDLVTEIYKTTKEFPTQEIYGITNQVRRAAVSDPSNIAEGAARQTKKEFRNFLHVVQGSVSDWTLRSSEPTWIPRPQLSKEPR